MGRYGQIINDNMKSRYSCVNFLFELLKYYTGGGSVECVFCKDPERLYR